MWKRIIVEILTILVIYVVGYIGIYLQIPDSDKADTWWISLICLVGTILFISICEYVSKKRKK